MVAKSFPFIFFHFCANFREKLPNPKPKKGKFDRMLEFFTLFFFNYRGIVYFEFLPKGGKVNKEKYLSMLHRLRGAIGRKRSYLWKDNSWRLHYGNASAHTSLLVQEFLS